MGFYYFVTKSSTWFYERQFKLCLDHFLPLLFFFSYYEHFVTCKYHLWFDTILFLLNFLSLRFLLEKILTCAINWTSACWWFCLGYFFLKKFYFGLKEGTTEILLIIWDGETWPYIISSLDYLIFREINSCNKFQWLSFSFLLLSYFFCLDFPWRVFNLTDSLFLLFSNAFEERRLKLSARNLHLIA